MSAQGKPVLELTLRGVIIGVIITLAFTAANVFLGLKVGLTFATSIPAAVISMAVLSLFKDLDDPGEQHRADGGLGRRHALRHHLRAAGTGDRRLVAGLPLHREFSDLRLGRHIGRAVHDPAAPRDGDDERPALSRRRRGGRGSRSRRRGARQRRRRGARGLARRRLRRRGGRRPGAARGDEHRRRRVPEILPRRRELGDQHRHGILAGAGRRGLPRGTQRRHGDAGRTSHRLGRRRAVFDRAASRRRRPSTSRRTRRRSGGRRCASSAPAPSRSPRCGRCSSSSDRW